MGVSNGKNFSRTVMTSFGAFGDESSFYTGKPKVDGLGYTFNFRNYRADQGKWQTADPLGYPDGFNNFAYVNNGVTDKIDYLGFWEIIPDSATGSREHNDNGFGLDFEYDISVTAAGNLGINVNFDGYFHNLHIPSVTCWFACEKKSSNDSKNFSLELDSNGVPSIINRPTISTVDGLTSGCIISGIDLSVGMRPKGRECVVSVSYLVFSSAGTLTKSDAKTALGVDFDPATVIPKGNLDLVINWTKDVANIKQSGNFLFTFVVE